MDNGILRRVQLTLLVTLAGWTAYWAVMGYAFLQRESIVMQQGFGADGIQLWELFNIQMLAAHYVVRWLPGALLLLAGLYLAKRAAQPARRSSPSAAGGPPTWNAEPSVET